MFFGRPMMFSRNGTELRMPVDVHNLQGAVALEQRLERPVQRAENGLGRAREGHLAGHGLREPDGRGLDLAGQPGPVEGFGHMLNLGHLDLGRAQKIFPLPVHAVGDVLFRTMHGFS
jgi:hypothetical protein